MGRSSFQHSALVGFGLATLVVLGLLVLASEYTTRHQRAIASVLHAQEIMTTLAAAESQLFRAEANQRAFLVSRDAAFASQREAAEAELRRLAEALAALTAADPPQRRRVAALRSLIDQRTAEYRALQARLGGGASIAPVELLGEGSAARRDFSDRFRAMFDEERRALATRRAEQLDRRAEQRRAIAALGIALALLAGAALWRVARDVAGRRAAELEAQEERLQDAAHARALRLYNETHDRAELLDGILALLAEQARTPVSAFYAHDASSGALRLVARHGTAADIPAVLPLGERVIGDVAREGRPVELPSSDSSAHLAAIVPAALRPAALLVAPVSHQGNLLGVLILAAAAALPPGERRFVERLCAHLGVALHNLCQIEGLSRLADRLRHSTAEISRKNEQLQQANRRTGEFVANLSHELRTPLNAVIGFSDLLRGGFGGPLNVEQQQYVREIHANGRHLLSLINDVLDLAKIEAGQMDLRLARTQPADLAASGIAVIREQAASRRVRVVETVTPGLGPLWVDPRKARQILYNLLSNAVKFTHEGGHVTLTLAKVGRDRVVAARAAESARVFPPVETLHVDWLEIGVADSGIGIAPDALADLFKPFMQLDSRLPRAQGGTGLGLTMVRRLVELHGGGLCVRSKPDRGTRFTVWLPWRGEPTERHETRGPSASPAVEAPLVLVIEDDPSAAEAIEVHLRHGGYRVQLASDARALPVASLQPRVIVIDVMLSRTDGWQLLARLQEGEATRHIPVVVVSVGEEGPRGFAPGGGQVLLKPVSRNDLLAALAASGLRRDGDGRVLVVDDDPAAVSLMCKQLQAAGIRCDTASGGRQALEAVERHRPDAIVLDLVMPEVSGFDVVERLARRSDTADLSIILLTARVLTAAERKSLNDPVRRIMDDADLQPATLLAEVKRATAWRSEEAPA